MNRLLTEMKEPLTIAMRKKEWTSFQSIVSDAFAEVVAHFSKDFAKHEIKEAVAAIFALESAFLDGKLKSLLTEDDYKRVIHELTE